MPCDLLFDLPYHLFCDMLFDLFYDSPCDLLCDSPCDLLYDSSRDFLCTLSCGFPYNLLCDMLFDLLYDLLCNLLCNMPSDLFYNLSFDSVAMPTALFVRSIHKFPSALPTPFFGRPCAILERLPLPATPPYTTFMAYFRCAETCNRSEGIHRPLLAAPRVPYSGIVPLLAARPVRCIAA